jgi:hypothetical protein
MTRSRLALVMFAVVLAGGLLIGRVAVSQKATTPGTVALPTRPPGNSPAAEKAHKVVNQIIDVGHWTAKDYEQVHLVFAPLHNDQKLEILRKVAAAIDAKKLVIEKGVRLF